MCLTVPRRVEKVEKNRARLQDGRWVKTTLLSASLKPGDMVLAQADMAVEKISKKHSQLMKESVL